MPQVCEDMRFYLAHRCMIIGSIPIARTKINKNNMERTLKGRDYTIAGIFKHIGKGNKLHVPLDCYSANSISVECTKQNKYAGCDPMNNKFATTTKEKANYITIIQRY